MACTVSSPRYRWWRWIITISTLVFHLLSLGLMFNYSILLLSLQKEFHSTTTITGWLGSLSSSLACISSLFTGLLEHRLNRRAIVLIGVVLYSGGYILTSFVPAIGYAYLTYGVAVGVGANFMRSPAMSLLLDWFSQGSFSRASAIAALGSTIGMLVFSPILTVCITQYGWRNALRIIGGGVFVVGIAAALLLTNPPADEDYNTVEDQSNNASPDQNHETETTIPLQDKHCKATGDEDQGIKDEEAKMMKEDECSVSLVESSTSTCRGTIDMMRNLDPWLFVFGNVFSFLGWTFFNINFADFMDGLGLDSNQIATVIMCFASGELGGKILIAVIGDRLPFLYVYVVAGSCLMGTVVLGILTVAKTYLTMILLSSASGFIRSGVYGAVWVADAQLFHEYGTNNIVMLSLVPTGVGTLISALVSGVLVDITGNYIRGLVVIAAIFTCAALLFLSIPIRRRIRSGPSCRPLSKPRPVGV